VRVLFDHCVPTSLRGFLAGHEVRTASEVDRQRAGDARLLDGAAGRFDVIVSVDRTFAAGALHPSVAIVILRAASNRLKDLAPLVADLIRTLEHPRRGERVEIGPLAK
jgi:predicted nuclease of predicted toxin-antitoxin system